jgi:O-methyltransferase
LTLLRECQRQIQKKDWHKKGDFSDTSLETVREYVGFEEIVKIRKGLLPLTFQGLEDWKFCFAHIDLDIYRSIWDTLDFVWPRLVAGGCVIFDDYGFPSCPGAREAVDEFFAKQDSVTSLHSNRSSPCFQSLTKVGLT